jgi:hypothetical protein
MRSNTKSELLLPRRIRFLGGTCFRTSQILDWLGFHHFIALFRRAISRHGHGHEIDLRQNELAQFDCDFLYLEFREQLVRQCLGESFDQAVSTALHKPLRFHANRCVVHRPPNLIAQFRSIASRPKHDVEDKPLSHSALFVRDAYVRENFELANLDVIVHFIPIHGDRMQSSRVSEAIMGIFSLSPVGGVTASGNRFRLHLIAGAKCIR